MRSTIHAASAVRIVERQGEQVATLPRLVAGRDHRLLQPLTGGDALGDRARQLDDAWLERKLSSNVTCRTPGYRLANVTMFET